jgi:hypothetical protein
VQRAEQLAHGAVEKAEQATKDLAGKMTEHQGA